MDFILLITCTYWLWNVLSTRALSNNSFENEIPESYYHLTSLVSLELQLNRLTGPITNDFTRMTSLCLL